MRSPISIFASFITQVYNIIECLSRSFLIITPFLFDNIANVIDQYWCYRERYFVVCRRWKSDLINVLQRRAEGVCESRGDAEGRLRQKGVCDILTATTSAQEHNMRLSDIKENQWYSTKVGDGICLKVGGTFPKTIKLDIKYPIPRGICLVMPRDVFRKINEPK